MKKMLFTALVAAGAMTACGTKTTETAAAAEEATREIGSSDIAYVQVEAVLAQCDLFLNEGKALQEKTQKAQKSWAQKEQNLQSEAAQLQEKYQIAKRVTFSLAVPLSTMISKAFAEGFACRAFLVIRTGCGQESPRASTVCLSAMMFSSFALWKMGN